MAKKNLKKLYPKAFESMQVERPKSKYSEEEKVKLFVEGKCRVPQPTKNKKKYDKKKERQRNMKGDW